MSGNIESNIGRHAPVVSLEEIKTDSFQWSLSLKRRSAMCLGNVSIGFNALLNAQRSGSSLTNTGREGGT
ncbi:hypothetical protein HanHA300_Chr04g0146701 [Helianthus annuus]|nr:hypothetical protein HanHA300_Chr04g0146701 [Helianthus annuus]KAJ0597916.1 hypothetical protein HanHA89_Chr04g0160061 [Helianthus annuus]KAJ0736426.1 hypothetical protein HanLR1_Chr06g0195891 [Helianthus annuus]